MLRSSLVFWNTRDKLEGVQYEVRKQHPQKEAIEVALNDNPGIKDAMDQLLKKAM